MEKQWKVGGNLHKIPPKVLKEEFSEVLLRGNLTRIERIVSMGHTSPDGFWYDQDEDEWVSVLAGRARIEFEQDEILLAAGDTAIIPAHQKHRVSFTSVEPPCVWLCVFGKFDEEMG